MSRLDRIELAAVVSNDNRYVGIRLADQFGGVPAFNVFDVATGTAWRSWINPKPTSR